MKKITLGLLMFCCFAFSWQASAQFTFPVQGPVNVDGATDVTLNFNDAGNSAGVPAGTYTNFTITADWTDGFNAYSTEAEVNVVTAAGTTTINPPSSGAFGNGDPASIVFSGVLAGDYDPSVDATLDVILDQTWTNSNADWANITLTISGPPATPDCATTPTPADGTIDIPVGNSTLSWVAPVSGPTPTAYNVYAYDDALGTNPDLVGTVTETSMDVTINAYETTIYWAAIPVNETEEATGCDIWSFTTEMAPPPPINDDCIGAVSITVDESFCDGTNNNGDNTASTDSGLGLADCFNYGENDVWFAFTVPAQTATVDISTDFTGGTLVDTEIAVYSGVCGTLVEQDCDNDSGTTTLSNGFAWNSVISDFPVVVGETYYVRVSGYNSERVGTFCLDIATNQALGLDDVSLSQFTYYPNPVNDKLTLNAQSNIQNVAVYNMLGQEVINASPNTLDAEVDMANLNSGAYFVKVTIDNATKTIRVIKN